MHRMTWAPLAALILFTSPARADVAVPQPGEQAQKEAEKTEREKKPNQGEAGPEEEHTWSMPPVYETKVQAQKPAVEDQLIGTYKQPRWTARRRWPTTRVYVRPAGTAEFEYWFDLRAPFTTDEISSNQFAERIRTQYEFEFGIGHRFQLDLYLRTQQNLDGSDNTPGRGPRQGGEVNEEKAELRWALANWGVIWGNPTLYVEYAHGDGSEALETKLLFGGDYGERLHWGFNLGLEHAFSPSESYHNEWLVTYGLAYGIVDSEFSLGGEVQIEMDEAAGKTYFWDALIGPSIAWHPIPQFNIMVAALVGPHWEKVGGASITQGKYGYTFQAHPLAVAGWEF